MTRANGRLHIVGVLWRHSADGETTGKNYAAHLEKLGRLGAQTATRF